MKVNYYQRLYFIILCLMFWWLSIMLEWKIICFLCTVISCALICIKVGNKLSNTKISFANSPAFVSGMLMWTAMGIYLLLFYTVRDTHDLHYIIVVPLLEVIILYSPVAILFCIILSAVSYFRKKSSLTPFLLGLISGISFILFYILLPVLLPNILD